MFGIPQALRDLAVTIQLIISDLFVGLARGCLGLINTMFNSSITALQNEVALTPQQFGGGNVVNVLRDLSEVTILPIAGIIITYIFCYEVYTLVTEKNKGDGFEIQSLLWLIIKTSVMITLVTNSFNIAMAFTDVGAWVVNTSIAQTGNTIQIDDTLMDEILQMIEPAGVAPDGSETPISELPDGELPDGYEWDFKLGTAFMVGFLSICALLVTMVMVAIIYLVAWSRMVMLLLYVSVAPLPMSTLMNRDWVGGLGQNYLKNLLALVLQGYVMIVLLVIYSGLIDHAVSLVQAETDAIIALVMMMVSMAIVVKMLMGSHSFSKSITNAS